MAHPNSYHSNGSSYGNQRTEYRGHQTAFNAQAHPARVPSVDVSAPVIHLGTRDARPKDRAQDDKGAVFLTAATKEQKLRSLFIGRISKKLDDFWMERLLKSIPKLAHWKRVLDGTGQSCSYGFAEYEDPESTDRAYRILRDVQVPVEAGQSETSHFLVTQDPMSKLYIEDSLAAKEMPINESKERSIMSTTLGQIEKVWRDFANPKYKRPDEIDGKNTKSAKPVVHNPANDNEGLTIMLNIEDELGDIPEEQRQSIAKEITSFRERSAKRDQERARQLADVEARRLELERSKNQEARDKVQGDPGEEIPLIRYTKSVPQNYAESGLSDEEIGQLRREKFLRDCEARYNEELIKWEIREDARIRSQKRDSSSKAEEAAKAESERAYLIAKFAKFDDDKESSRLSVDFYRDRGAWSRARAAFRAREIEADHQNRLEERRELEQESKDAAAKATNPAKQDIHEGKSMPDAAPVRLSLAKRTADSRKGFNNTEVVLAEEEENKLPRRPLVPLQDENEPEQSAIDQEDAQTRLKEIVDRIPADHDELFQYKVEWDRLSQSILDKVRIFVAKKVVEVIGMEEDDLTNLIVENISHQGHPEEIENELNAIIGDAEESALTTTRIWRYFLIVLETSDLLK